MRPLALTVEGLRSFRHPVEIDFRNREHVAIIGDTGAGKSSLLEAMTWVLYGRTSWSAQANQELMNATSTQLRVVLRFVVNKQAWEATRVLKRKADRTVGPAQASLTRYDDAGMPIEKVEKVTSVEKRVIEILGLDADAFTRTVILPQGQFHRLLVGDKDTDRSSILKQVWRLDDLAAAREVARQAHDTLAPVRARVEQALEGEPEDLEAHRSELAARSLKRGQEEADAATLAESVERERANLRRAEEDARSLGTAAGALQLDGDLRPEAERVRAGAESINGERAVLEGERASLLERLSAVPADDDGLSEGSVGEALAHLATIEEGVPLALSAAQAARQTMASAAEAKVNADRAASEAGAKKAAVESLRAREGQLETAAQCAEDRVKAAQGELSALRDLHVRTAEKRQSEKEATESASATKASLAEAQGQVAAAIRMFEGARDLLAGAQRHHAAAHASSGLVAGSDTCPVCCRTLPGEWSVPLAPGLEDLQEALTAAETTLREARESAVRLETTYDREVEEAGEFAKGAVRLEAQATQRSRDLGAELGLEQLVIEEDDVVILRTVLAPSLAAQLALREHGERVFAGERAFDEASTTAALANQAAKNERKAADRELKSAQDRCDALRELLRKLPSSLGVILELPESCTQLESADCQGIDQARMQLEERRRVLGDRKADREALARKRDGIDAERAKVEKRWQIEVMKSCKAVLQKLEGHRENLARVAGMVGEKQGQLPVLTGLNPEDLPGAVSAIGVATDLLKERIQERHRQATGAVREAVATLRSHGEALGLTAAQPDPEEIERVAAARLSQARYEARAAREAEREFAARLEPLSRLRATAADLNRRTLALSDLVQSLQDGGFPKWLSLRRSRDLLVHASKLLSDMTADRYAFADLDDENAEWLVVDRDTGLPRSPASLSGGEKFVASLALALGMVEMMARAGGRLESLWLDEGFGALDRSNLDAAVDALARVASGGRLVAVISHVRAIAEQVTDVLAVTRTGTGSTARWLSQAERGQLIDGDAQAGVSDAAVSGLLE